MTDIVLPPLTTWTEMYLSSILKATTQADFDAAFDAFVAKDVTVVFNGAKITRDQLKRKWQGEKSLETSATVNFSGGVSVPADKNDPIVAGVVGVFFTATIVGGFRIHDAPVEHTLAVASSVNVTVVQDKSLHPPTGPIRGFFDGRRISNLNQVVLDQPVPIHSQTPPA